MVETSVTGEPVTPLQLTSEERYERDRLFMRDTRSPSQLAALGYDAFLTPIAVDVREGTVTDLETGTVYKSFEKQLYNEDGTVGELWKGYSRQASAEDLARAQQQKESYASFKLFVYLVEEAGRQMTDAINKLNDEMAASDSVVSAQLLKDGKPVVSFNTLGGYQIDTMNTFEGMSMLGLASAISQIFDLERASEDLSAIQAVISSSGFSSISFVDKRSAATQSVVERQKAGTLLRDLSHFIPKVTNELMSKLRSEDTELGKALRNLTAEGFERVAHQAKLRFSSEA
ncbi:MAG: hypothetical protein EAZ99_19510 [Alphaproteobacteria bacterium]|nr:MAG: hypothetical protein EAZ99_19510 [Alphaproteobacteria bacterium]